MSRHRPAAGGRTPAITPEAAGWSYTGLHVVTTSGGRPNRFDLPDDEVVVVPLAGTVEVRAGSFHVVLGGRDDVFEGAADRVYLPPGTPFVVDGDEGGEVAICTARATAGGDPIVLTASETTVEARGAGRATRAIRGVWPAEVTGPERLIVVEVLTPGGNWSSHPPHKHDVATPGESVLEEVYYFRFDHPEAFGSHRSYGGDVAGDVAFDETVAVRHGDVYLVDRGFHGPCAAAPGYDMYYLNVMAGPERRWDITTDPAHAWLWDAWADEPPDPRVTAITSRGR